MQQLPTELIGSYALPSWLHIVTERIAMVREELA